MSAVATDKRVLVVHQREDRVLASVDVGEIGSGADGEDHLARRVAERRGGCLTKRVAWVDVDRDVPDGFRLNRGTT
jgi:hypothetical protein